MQRSVRFVALVVAVLAIGGVVTPVVSAQEPQPSPTPAATPSPAPSPTPDPTPAPAETPTPAPQPTDPPAPEVTATPAATNTPQPAVSPRDPAPTPTATATEPSGSPAPASNEAEGGGVPLPCELVDCASPGSTGAAAIAALLAEECYASGCPADVMDSASGATGVECGPLFLRSCTWLFEELTQTMLAGDCDSACATSSVDLALELAEGALTAACPDGAASLCASDSFEPSMSYGAMVTGILDGAAAATYELACAGAAESCAAAYRSALVDVVLPRIDPAYAVVCGLFGAGTCVERQEMLARLLTWGYYDAAPEIVCSTECASRYRDAVAGVVTALADQAAPHVCGAATAAACGTGSRASAFAVIGNAVLPSSGVLVQIQRGVTGTCGVTLETHSSSAMEVAGVSNPCLDAVVTLANTVLTVACGSTDAVACANELVETTNELLVSVCSDSVASSARWAALTPDMWSSANVSHPCVDLTVAAVNLVLRTACASTDPVTCANNLVTKINQLLITACTITTLGPDSSPPEVAGIEFVNVSHPCVERTFEAVNTVLTTTCGSTDVAVCANNLIREINELLISACTLSNVGYDSSPPEVNGIELLAVSHPCVEKAFEAVNSVLTAVCDSTDAATCALNLVDTINALLISVCTESIVSSESPSVRVVNGIELADVSHPCVQTALAVVNLVLTTACGSTDAATCANNLIREINELLVSVCTQPVLDTDAGPVTVNGVEVTNVSHPCVEAAYDVVALVLTTACGSADAGTCADNLLTAIDDLVVSACEAAPVEGTGGPVSDEVTLSHPCVDAVLDAVDLVVSSVCGSRDAQTCVQDLLTQIGDLVEDACAAGPAPTSPLTSLTSDAGKTVSNQCVEKVLEVVNIILSTVCDEADAADCSTGLLDDVAELLAASCGVTTGVDSSDPHGCAQAALDLVMGVLPNVCVGAVDVELALVDCSSSAADALGDLTETALEQVNASVVDFQVYPRRIDPSAGAGPRVVNVAAQVTLGAWRIEIRDANGQPVRVFPGFTGLTAVTWDGRDALGSVVPAGAYEVVLLAADDDLATESAWVFVGSGPSIGGVFPASVSIGDSLTVTGSGFTRGLGVFGVTIGNEEAAIVTWSDTHVVVHVPPTLKPGTYDLTLTAADADASVPVTVKNYIPVSGSNSASVMPGLIRVQLRAGSSMGTVAAAIGDTTFEPSAPAGYPELASWYDVTVPSGFEGSRILAYANRPEVAFAEPVLLSTPTATPNDRLYKDQWYLKTQPADNDIDAPEAWSIRKASSSITVAVLDTQVGAHPDLDIVSLHDYPGSCAHSLRAADHGTFVAGQAAARTNNTEGVAGVAWGGRVREYRLGYTYLGDCYIGDYTDALLLAAQQDDVANMSFGQYSPSSYVQDVIDQAWARGLLMAAAAGNDSTTVPHYPSSYRHVVSVGALNRQNGYASFSNRGRDVDVYAPGVEAVSTARTSTGASNYEGTGWQGTSMASPLVAGALALLRAHAPTVPSGNLVYALENSTQGSPPRLSINNALSKIIRITLPSGLFVKTSTGGTVWFLDEGGVKRRVGSRVLQSWGIPSASSSHVAVVRPELLELGYATTGPSLGFRPGTLLRQSGSSTTYVVTTDGSDPWLKGQKRALTPEVMLCLHYDEARVMEVGKSELDLHPTGTSVGCDRHPNGTLIKTPTVGGTPPGVTTANTLEVLVNGQRRKFLTSQLAGTWGYTQDAVLPAPGDLLLPTGANMGFRPGKILRNGGKLWVVTAGGTDLARATIRQFSTATSINCYRLQGVPRINATTAELAIHGKGSTLGC